MGSQGRALILSSGGLKACWQVGVLKALAESGDQWDVVCGCSAGSVNAGMLCMFDVGNELKAVNYLEDMWMSYSKNTPRPSCLYAKALFTMINGSQSIQDDFLLHSLCDPICVHDVKLSTRKLYVLANSLTTGGHVFSSDYPQLKRAIVSSMSVPGLFPAQKLDLPYGKKEWFVDGAMSTSIPHFIEDMEVDVVLANTTKMEKASAPSEAPPSVTMNLMNSLDTEMEQTTQRSLTTLRQNNKSVRVFQPPRDLERKQFYEMTHQDVRNEIDMSYDMTKSGLL